MTAAFKRTEKKFNGFWQVDMVEFLFDGRKMSMIKVDCRQDLCNQDLCDQLTAFLTLFWTGGGKVAPPAGFFNIAQKPLGLGS